MGGDANVRSRARTYDDPGGMPGSCRCTARRVARTGSGTNRSRCLIGSGTTSGYHGSSYLLWLRHGGGQTHMGGGGMMCSTRGLSPHLGGGQDKNECSHGEVSSPAWWPAAMRVRHMGGDYTTCTTGKPRRGSRRGFVLRGGCDRALASVVRRLFGYAGRKEPHRYPTARTGMCPVVGLQAVDWGYPRGGSLSSLVLATGSNLLLAGGGTWVWVRHHMPTGKGLRRSKG